MENQSLKNLLINNINSEKLSDNYSKIEKAEFLVIIDLYHICAEESNKTDLDMIKYFDTVKEYSIYDKNIFYVFFHSNNQKELIENTKSLNDLVMNNVFLEDKLTNISFVSGFCMAKDILVYLFTDANNQIGSWIKIKDIAHENKIKVSELDYFKITLDYLLKEKKRKHEQEIIKTNKSRLSKILEESNKEMIEKRNNHNDGHRYLKNLLANDKESDKSKNNINNGKNNNLNYKDKTNIINKKRPNTSNQNNPSAKEKNFNYEKGRKSEIEEYLSSYKFSNFFNKIKKYIFSNPPKNFEVLKNIINHFSEQNIISINNNFKDGNTNTDSIKADELSFYILKELLKREFILNNKFNDLINSKIVNNLDEISNLLNFHININSNGLNGNNVDEEETCNRENLNLKEEIKTDNFLYINSNTNQKLKFSLSEKSEEDYKNLILNCQSICLFVKNVIEKILNSINLSSLEKLPTNPAKYRNYIFSFVNNQELFKISKKILNMDYNILLNTITEGIIVEFMKNTLIIFITDKKIHYNMKEIEKEKFRLFKTKNIQEGENIKMLVQNKP